MRVAQRKTVTLSQGLEAEEEEDMYPPPRPRSGATRGDGSDGLLAARLTFLERLVTEKFEARDIALTVALRGMEKRLEGMNEFRATLTDQAARFVPLTEMEKAVNAVWVDIRRLELTFSQSPTRSELTTHLANADGRIKVLEITTTQGPTRTELNSQITVIDSRLKALEIATTHGPTRAELDNQITAIDIRLKAIETHQANFDGRLWMLGGVFTLGNVILSWVLSSMHVIPNLH